MYFYIWDFSCYEYTKLIKEIENKMIQNKFGVEQIVACFVYKDDNLCIYWHTEVTDNRVQASAFLCCLCYCSVGMLSVKCFYCKKLIKKIEGLNIFQMSVYFCRYL